MIYDVKDVPIFQDCIQEPSMSSSMGGSWYTSNKLPAESDILPIHNVKDDVGKGPKAHQTPL